MLVRLFTFAFGVLSHVLLYRWAIACWPRLQRFRLAYGIAVVALLVLGPVSRWAVVTKHILAVGPFATALSIESITVMIAMAPLGILRLASFIANRIKRAPAPAPVVESSNAPAMTRRQIVEAVAGSTFLAATGSMLGWGMVRGRHAFQIDEVVVKIAGLPRILDGYTIAQVSDIHVGAYIGDHELDEGLSLIANIRPDLIVATGDLVDIDDAFAPMIARRLADLKARDGVAAILGNHDHYAGADTVAAALRAAGVKALVNEGMHIRASDGGGFALLGVDDISGARRRGKPGVGPMLARADAMVVPDIPRILLSHQPSTVDLWAGRVALQLSGHTHGGQINPGFRPAEFIMKYISGRFEVRGTTLYVNRGFGTVGPPARIGAPPEVTKVVLVAG